jgi:beta-galactosidase
MIDVAYNITQDGEIVAEGTLQECAIAPHEAREIQLEADVPSEGLVILNLFYSLKVEDIFQDKGHELGFDQLILSDGKVKDIMKHPIENGTVTYNETDTHIEINGVDFKYVFNKIKGVFEHIEKHSRPVIMRPMEFNVWRAPMDNDMWLRNTWSHAGYDRTYVKVYDTTVCQGETGMVKVICKSSLVSDANMRVVTCETQWCILSNGMVKTHMEVERNTLFEQPSLPRFGIRMFLEKAFEEVTYLGYGPNESYIDMHQSSMLGKHKDNVSNMHIDNIKPQENGSHYGTRYVTLKNKNGMQLLIQSEQPFSFNVSEYSQEELTIKRHNYELEKSPYSILCIDYKQSGTGSSSCCTKLSEQYEIKEEKFVFDFEMQIV